jgi:Protein of unknown function (DUF1572)
MLHQFLPSAIARFEQYKSLAEKAMHQINEEQLFVCISSESNSIAMLVQHLHGNMLSRWTDFLTTDGEKEGRQRDAEFEAVIKTKTELLEKWEAGWACLLNTLKSLNENDLQKIITIRNEKHTVMDAIHRQMMHYSYHVGQMVLLAKALSNEDFQSLSIPKNQSKDFNEKMMGK